MNDANNAGTLLPFRQYRRKQIAELRPWKPGDDMTGISVSAEDARVGSPMLGDMIARNPKNHADQWLVATVYFVDNFEPVADALSTPNAPVEPAGLRSLRHLLAHMPDKDLHLRRFDAQQLLQFIDAILAVRLDEAAIRKDEREKCAAIAEQPQFANVTRVEVFKGPEWTEETGSAALVCAHARIIASAIRNGGKQP